MNKEELMALLRNPGQTGQVVDELNRLIEENPYFHTGHQLYIKGLQQTDEQQMALQLGRTALSVRDRGVLYNYLNRPSSFRQQPSLSPDHGETEAPFIPGNTFVSPDVDIHNIQQTPPDPATSIPRQNPLTIGGWQNTDEHLSVDEKILSSEELMDVVRRQLKQIDRSSQGEEKSHPLSEDHLTSSDVEVRDEYTEDQLLADLIQISPIRSDMEKTSPLDVVIKETTPGDVAVAEEKQELSSYNLIDSFLKSNPKIIPDDSYTYQVDLTESLQENQDIATETLADIYATQGHKNKAIEIYEHLSLKYPEKDIYFAAQIERLKE